MLRLARGVGRRLPKPLRLALIRRIPVNPYERLMWRLSRHERSFVPEPSLRSALTRFRHRALLATGDALALRRSGRAVVVSALSRSADLAALSQANLDLVVDVC